MDLDIAYDCLSDPGTLRNVKCFFSICFRNHQTSNFVTVPITISAMKGRVIPHQPRGFKFVDTFPILRCCIEMIMLRLQVRDPILLT